MQFGYWIASWLNGACPVCGKPHWSGVCAECRTQGGRQRETHGGLSCFALGHYDGALQDYVGRLKYGDETWLASYLGGALSQLLPRFPPHTTLVPVPLHPTRLAERSYNQSALLARAVARQLRLRVRYDLVERRLVTAQQALLTEHDRALNVRNAFIGQPIAARQHQDCAPLLLVDDVITTGHTVDACAEALVNAGYVVRGAICCALGGKD